MKIHQKFKLQVHAFQFNAIFGFTHMFLHAQLGIQVKLCILKMGGMKLIYPGLVV